jgi:hypothetical protein
VVGTLLLLPSWSYPLAAQPIGRLKRPVQRSDYAACQLQHA